MESASAMRYAARIEMLERKVPRYQSSTMLFLIAAGCMVPLALFSRIDNWFEVGNDLSGMFCILAAGYVFLFWSVSRGATW